MAQFLGRGQRPAPRVGQPYLNLLLDRRPDDRHPQPIAVPGVRVQRLGHPPGVGLLPLCSLVGRAQRATEVALHRHLPPAALVRQPLGPRPRPGVRCQVRPIRQQDHLGDHAASVPGAVQDLDPRPPDVSPIGVDLVADEVVGVRAQRDVDHRMRAVLDRRAGPGPAGAAVVLAQHHPLRLPRGAERDLHHLPVPLVLVEPVVVEVQRPVLDRDVIWVLVPHHVRVHRDRRPARLGAQHRLVEGLVGRVVGVLRAAVVAVPHVEEVALVRLEVEQVQHVQPEQHVDVEPQPPRLPQPRPFHDHVHRLGAEDLGRVEVEDRRVPPGQLGVAFGKGGIGEDRHGPGEEHHRQRDGQSATAKGQKSIG